MLGRPDHGRGGSLRHGAARLRPGQGSPRGGEHSKRLAPATRERLARAVLAHAEAVSLVSIPASQIDRIGLRAANLACLERALRAVGERAELRFVDGYTLGASAPVHERIVRGDATSATVAAASIVAKAARDRLMTRLGELYPGYGFERHKGYGTNEHKAAVAKLGPTREHRLTFNFRRLTEAVVVAGPARRGNQRRAAWRELPAAEMAAHLLETPTVTDRAWTDEPRLPRETRTAFIRRVLLGERGLVEAPESETAATETASGAARPRNRYADFTESG